MKKIKENKFLTFDIEKELNLKYIIRKALNVFDNLYYGILYKLIKPSENTNSKYNVSICAIFRDEAPYLKEWIEFHKIIGIDHFYLYNNGSEDNYLEILKPYVDKGDVTLVDWFERPGQMSAYKNCMENNAAETRWMGFIDLDEYVIPNDYDNIYDFLSKFEKDRPVVILYWKMIGTSGYLKRDINGLITEDLTIGWKKYSDIGKLFFNTKYPYDQNLKKNGYMHYMWAKYRGVELPPVNAFNRVCTRGFNSVPSNSMPVQINHYVIKSFDEYTAKKMKRGGGVHDVGMHDYTYFYKHEQGCQYQDYHAYKYLIRLKRALNKEK